MNVKGPPRGLPTGLVRPDPSGITLPPVAAYVPPRAPQAAPAVLEVNSKIEIQSMKVAPLAGVIAGPREFPLFTMKQTWKALDVYVSPPDNLLTTAWIRVFVYAVLEGVGRVLVATGYYSPAAARGATATVSTEANWICAARARCSRFEVTYTPLNFQAAANEMVFTAIGSDDASEAPPWVGVMPLDEIQSSLATIAPSPGAAVTIGDFRTQVVKAVAENETTGAPGAIPLWFQGVDAVSVAAAANVIPHFSILVPAGQSVLMTPEQLSGYRFGANGLVLGGSTTPNVFTVAAVGNLRFQAWIR